MELSTQEVEELEVTIVPSTVAEIIYLKEQEWDENNALSDDESSCFQHLQPVDLNDETIPREDFANSTTSDKDKSNDRNFVETAARSLQNFSELEYICTVCKTKCSSLPSLIEHTQTHEIDFEYKCNFCDEKFIEAQNLIDHCQTHHVPFFQYSIKTKSISGSNSREIIKFSCDACDEEFVNLRLLEKHRESHLINTVCKICGCGPFIGTQSLEAHYRNHEPKRYSCILCGAEYNNMKLFQDHKKFHETNFLYACSICDEGFPSTSTLSLHIRHVHAKVKAKCS